MCIGRGNERGVKWGRWGLTFDENERGVGHEAVLEAGEEALAHTG